MFSGDCVVFLVYFSPTTVAIVCTGWLAYDSGVITFFFGEAAGSASDFDLLCFVCVWCGDGGDLDSGRLRLSMGVCPETGGLVIVLLSLVGFWRRISVGEDGGGCFQHVSLLFERLTHDHRMFF
ncbi:unnamed protein product [Brassica oleracea var. botrytis]